MKRLFLLCLFLLFAFSLFSAADEHEAAGLTPAQIQAAVNLCSPGDIAVLPAGTNNNYNALVTVPNGVSMRGAGKGVTILNKGSNVITGGPGNTMLYWNASKVSSAYPVSISGMTLIGADDGVMEDKGIWLELSEAGIAFDDLKIYDIEFHGLGHAAIYIQGWSYGVIYDCDFIDCNVSGSGYGVGYSPVYGTESTYGAYAWATWPANTDPGWGANTFLFIEDCYFHLCRHAVSAGWGAKYVFRYNTSDLTTTWLSGAQHIDVHGKGTGFRAARAIEAYENLVTNIDPPPGEASDALATHGGDFLIYSNTFGINLADTPIIINDNNVVSYPDSDQARDSYCWDNISTVHGDIDSDFYPTNPHGIYIPNQTDPPYIVKERDVHLHARDGYAAYTYPHPLRGAPPGPEINITYDSTTIPDGGTYNFGFKSVGTNTNQVFTLENTGEADLTLSGSPIIVITGTNADQFSVQVQPTTPIVGSGNTTFTLRFSPTSEGEKNAVIAIVNNDADENPYNISLRGTGHTSGWYVDQTGGDDGNSGTSPSDAWKTIAKVNGSSFSAGDSVLFKRGETWSETLTVPSSGTSGSPITFGAYGTGDDPVIDGSTTLSSWTSEEISTPTLDAHQDLTDGGRTNGSAGYTMGQSFKPTVTATLNSVEVHSLSTPTVSMTLRIGTSNNLTSYTETITRSVTTGGEKQWVVFTSATNPMLTANTTYYIGVVSTDGNPETDIYDGASQYPDGSYYYGTGVDWNMSTNVSTRNLTFRINLNEDVATVYYATLANVPNVAWEDGTSMLKRQEKANMPVNSWWYDDPNNRLYIRTSGDDSPAGYTITAPARDYGIDTDACDYLTFSNLTICYTNTVGLRIKTGSTNIIIEDSDLYQHGSAIAASGSGSLITRCTIHDGHIIIDDATPDNDYGATGVDVQGSGHEISYCTFYNLYAPCTDYVEDGGGVEIYRDSTDIDGLLVHHNIFTNTSGFMEIGGSGGNVSNISVYYNIFIENRGTPDNWFSIHNSGGFSITLSNLLAYNNTVVTTGGASAEAIWFTSSPAAGSFIMKNNLIYATGYVTMANYAPPTHTYNCYWNPDDEEWAIGYSLGTGEIQADPLMISPATGDFTLQSTSPCINAGVDVNLTEDYAGKPIVGLPDIGAYEYVQDGSIIKQIIKAIMKTIIKSPIK